MDAKKYFIQIFLINFMIDILVQTALLMKYLGNVNIVIEIIIFILNVLISTVFTILTLGWLLIEASAALNVPIPPDMVKDYKETKFIKNWHRLTNCTLIILLWLNKSIGLVIMRILTHILSVYNSKRVKELSNGK